MMNKKAQANVDGGQILPLIITISLATVLLVFVGVLVGSSYNLIESDLEVLAIQHHGNKTFTALWNQSVFIDYFNGGTTDIYQAATNLDANFTVDANLGTVTLDDVGLNNTQLNISYQTGNDTLVGYLKGSVVGATQGIQTTGQYLPLIVLAFVISIVMVLILGFASIGGGTGGARGGGNAL